MGSFFEAHFDSNCYLDFDANAREESRAFFMRELRAFDVSTKSVQCIPGQGRSSSVLGLETWNRASRKA